MNRLSIGSSQHTVISTDNLLYNKTNLNLWTVDNSWYYLQLKFINYSDDTVIEQDNGSVSFSVKFINAIITNSTNEWNSSNTNDSYLNRTTRIYRNNFLKTRMVYEEYMTVLQRLYLPFTYFYHVGLNLTPMIIQLDTNNFVSVPFYIMDELDSGGTIKISLSFVNESFVATNEQYKIVGCIKRDVREIPVWPFHCKENENKFVAPILFNSSKPSSSVYLPFPEPGRWFLTFRLFCNACDPCRCSENCQSTYEICTETCEQDCKSENDCSQCTETCRYSILNTDACKGCDCEGDCLKTNTSCNTSVMIQIMSSPCVDGSCGQQGTCSLILNQGYAMSTCRCRNNYRDNVKPMRNTILMKCQFDPGDSYGRPNNSDGIAQTAHTLTPLEWYFSNICC
ncbi:uncharacterized protein LOC108736929 isoform X2 [Agrilus planipennis]|uniref:Uncharacterized protein LOC108736929 isoform X2 n=1 Tax=Agrilus planipennis TaxID=224129 RepID=A0A1W4WWZ8_AGRPL|nr:uncharacterized protein LOC108736929 isoform X2 [Agrilus planipennis]